MQEVIIHRDWRVGTSEKARRDGRVENTDDQPIQPRVFIRSQ